jgi:hypothetical protein
MGLKLKFENPGFLSLKKEKNRRNRKSQDCQTTEIVKLEKSSDAKSWV